MWYTRARGTSPCDSPICQGCRVVGLPPRAVDQFGQVTDVVVSAKRDRAATRRSVIRAVEHGSRPSEVSTDRVSRSSATRSFENTIRYARLMDRAHIERWG